MCRIKGICGMAIKYTVVPNRDSGALGGLWAPVRGLKCCIGPRFGLKPSKVGDPAIPPGFSFVYF